MNQWRYISRSLLHHRWTHLSVLAAVAVATAVLTGALVVGDSVRESLRELALERLGSIDHVLIGDRFFDTRRAAEVARESGEVVAAGIVAQATVQTAGSDAARRVRGVTLIGFDDTFWRFGNDAPQVAPGQVAINAALAEELQVEVGSRLTLRLPDANQVPADSTLGRKDDRLRSLTNLQIAAILDNEGLGKFSLHPTQQTTFNAFVPLATVQRALARTEQANAMFVGHPSSDASSSDNPPNPSQLNDALRPTLEDFGISVTRQTQTFEEQVVWDYFNITSDRMIWDDVARDAVNTAVDQLRGQEVFTYLANRISKTKTKTKTKTPSKSGSGDVLNNAEVAIPYSTITAANNHPQLGPLVGGDAKILANLDDDEIALNDWAAGRLEAKIGDEITVEFFNPESTHGDALETSATFRLAAIVPFTEPDQAYRRGRPATFAERPTLANDPHLTPTVEGVTDQQSINDWDPPFPFDPNRITAADDEYWENHRTTPKAFLSLAAGKQLWSSRFGANTSFRIPADGITQDELETALTTALRSRQQELGFRFRPIRAQALQAAQGTTPFEYLFLGFSFFLIASALSLIAILFRLGLDLRAEELGTLLATGWTNANVRRVCLTETAIVAGAGSLLGILGGVGYAAMMLAGLRTWWVRAVVTPFMRLHAWPATLLIGLLCGMLTALVVVWFSLRGLRRVNATRLLAGRLQDDRYVVAPHRIWPMIAVVLVILAQPLALVALRFSGELQAGLFFSSGALVLIGILLWIRYRLRLRATVAPSDARMGSLGLAWRSAARNPGRSTLTISLMAAATFLIVAIAAFRIAPTESGTGGFTLMAESDRPLHDDFANSETRRELFGNEAAQLAGVDILGLRVHGGDDASCRNLYQSSQPRLLGVSQQMIEYFDTHPDQFAWSGNASTSENPWRSLQPSTGGPIAVVIDKNTAMYALHLPPTVGHEFELVYDAEPIKFRVAGLLSNTVLQGGLLLSEDDLVRIAPQTSGYQMFLIRAPDSSPTHSAAITGLLENRFSDEGLDVKSTAVVLRDLLAVQNTYLSTFQSLGALGLLLGTLGLAAVQIRNVISRRGELGLLQAVGFSAGKIRWQIAYENATLLVTGLGIGLTAALLTVVPHWLAGAARFPVGTLAVTLLVILLVGVAAGFVAAIFAGRGRVVSALRGD